MISAPDELSVYIHWPFCESKCPYCDFASRPLREPVDFDIWQNAYKRALSFYHDLLPNRKITTIYFGGGTPSLMPPALVGAVLDHMNGLWPVSPSCEITLEANPSSSEKGKFQAFRAAGVNRLSLGVQSLREDSLRFLGRRHNRQEALDALAMTASTFDRFSFDLIYALAQQTPQEWGAELREALSFGASHMSLYQLTIEDGTPFAKRAQQEILCADEDTALTLYEQTQEIMEKAGLPAYEISNHARIGRESRHNLAYWHYKDYIGIGPSAHGRLTYYKDFCGHAAEQAKWACINPRQPQDWLDLVAQQNHGTESFYALSEQEAMQEALLMGLRLRSGIALDHWARLFGAALQDFIPQERLDTLVKEGLIQLKDNHCCATNAGRQRLNAVLGFLMG